MQTIIPSEQNSIFTGATTTSLSVTLANAIPAGAAIIVIDFMNSSASTAVVGGSGSPWKKRVSFTTSGVFMEIWDSLFQDAQPAGTTIQLQFASQVSGPMWVFVVPNIAAFDVAGDGTGTSTSPSTGAVTPATTGEFIIGAALNAINLVPTAGPTNGFTASTQTPGNAVAAYITDSSNASISTAWTIASSQLWLGVIGAYKVVPGVVGVPTGVAVKAQTVGGGGPPVGRILSTGSCVHPNGKVYVFGGANASGNLSDMWSYDPVAKVWAQITTVHNPGSIMDFNMCYDPVTASIIGFGGQNGSVDNANTWSIDPTVGTPDWTQLTPTHAPAARVDHRMFPNPVNGQVCLYGGADFSGSPRYDDLWTWTGTDWTEITAALTGTARSAAQVTTGSTYVLIFGGFGTSTTLQDTWEWDGTTATQKTPTVAPPARGFAGLAYHPARNQFLMFGGGDEGTDNWNDWWIWNGTDWSLILPTTGTVDEITDMAFVYCPSIGQIVMLFGADANTTSYLNTVWHITFGPTVTHVQQVEGNGTNKTTITVVPQRIGNLWVINVQLPTSSSATVTNVTDGGATPTGTDPRKWALTEASPFSSGHYGRCEKWSATISAIPVSEPVTITVTYSATPGGNCDLSVAEYDSGLGTGTVWTVVNKGASANTANVTTIAFPSLASSGDQQVYDGYAFFGGAGGITGTTPGFTYSFPDNTSIWSTTAPGPATIAPTATSPSGAYNAVGAVFSASTYTPIYKVRGMPIAVSRAANF